jgi:hypothetical protein
MKFSSLQVIRGPFFKLTIVSCAVLLASGQVNAATVSSGVDSTRNVVFSVNTDSGDLLDSEEFGFWGVQVDSGYNYVVSPNPSTAQQLVVRNAGIDLNRNTGVAGTLGVSGAATLQSTLGVTGATTTRGITNTGNVGTQTLSTSGLATLNSASVSNNATVGGSLGVTGATTLSSTLGVVGAATLGSTLDVTGVSTLGRSTIAGATGNAATVLKGGTNSGILTLQDGDTTTSGSTPAGTSITISGSGGGTAATVFQTTTNANTTSVTTTVGTNASYADGSTAALQAGPTNAVTVNSGNAGATPGVSINGSVGTGSTSTTGVLITGSGQNSQTYSATDRTNGVTPTWADVAIQSKSYGLGDPTLGSAILITDYGIQMISPQPITGQLITNNTGINNSTGNMVNNSGMNTSSGSVTNNTGGNSGSGSATNNLGMNSSTSGGTVANNIGGTSGNGNVTNTIGQNNGTGIATNGFGTGTGVTNNFIGNNNPGSTVQLDGGPSRMTLNGNGATFSNPSTGGPIQLHGVANGSSPNDAVNVRQLYSGVAASMATAPMVTNLKPGDAGVGVGFGQYGGYSATGISLTYFARNEPQLNLGIARSMHSGAQTAIRASAGFKF